jgi:hypothetical protein
MTHSVLVDIPRVFWHPELKLPKEHHYGERLASFDEKCQDFLDAYKRFLDEEQTGRVAKSTIFQVVSAAWRLKRDWKLHKRPEVESIIKTQISDLVRKYGMTRIWKAGYASTFQRRIEEELGEDDETLERRYQCGRCGREIWNPLSVKRGIGPVCYHKRGA